MHNFGADHGGTTRLERYTRANANCSNTLRFHRTLHRSDRFRKAKQQCLLLQLIPGPLFQWRTRRNVNIHARTYLLVRTGVNYRTATYENRNGPSFVAGGMLLESIILKNGAHFLFRCGFKYRSWTERLARRMVLKDAQETARKCDSCRIDVDAVGLEIDGTQKSLIFCPKP